MVRTIVVTYSREELPVQWIQVFRRCEWAISKAGLDVRVRFDPLEDLPETFDVLVVPPALSERARAAAPDALIVPTTREQVATAAADLVRELESGRSLTAGRVPPDRPKIAVHRGWDVL